MIGEQTFRTVSDNAMKMTGELMGFGRNMWLAGLGTVATVETEVKDTFGTLDERADSILPPGIDFGAEITRHLATAVFQDTVRGQPAIEKLFQLQHRFVGRVIIDGDRLAGRQRQTAGDQ